MVMLQVKVVPGSSRSRVVGKYGDGIKVQVVAAAEKGKANRAVVEVIAGAFGVRESQVVIVAGHTQPRKMVQIDMSEEQLRGKLAELE
jgi:uncharacterized protein (TIGR00251 family)